MLYHYSITKSKMIRYLLIVFENQAEVAHHVNQKIAKFVQNYFLPLQL